MRPFLLTAALAATLLLAVGCSRPWSHPQYSGAEADAQFKSDTYDCKLAAMDTHPYDKHKQSSFYEACMKDKGWRHERDTFGYRFSTAPKKE